VLASGGGAGESRSLIGSDKTKQRAS